MTPTQHLEHSAQFPYDAPDSWWKADETPKPPPAKDWAHRAARAILSDLTDRRGIKQEFESVDEEVRVDIVKMISEIIRRAHFKYGAPETVKSAVQQ